tara:strand:- start:1857 stop:2456 length:600 start_codon:yes stop_codon:yes gene_type:complete
MIAVPSTAVDIRKYFESTYIKINGFGDTLFYVRRVREDIITGIDENNTEFELDLWEDSPFTIDYILPHRAVFQYGNTALLLRRVPARQYFRGIHPENTKLTSVDTGEEYPINFETLKAFVNKQQYVTLDEAIVNKPKKKAHALSPRFSYITAGQSINLDNTNIAHINLKEKLLFIKHPIFTQEIVSYLKQTNSSLQVTQ